MGLHRRADVPHTRARAACGRPLPEADGAAARRAVAGLPQDRGGAPPTTLRALGLTLTPTPNSNPNPNPSQALRWAGEAVDLRAGDVALEVGSAPLTLNLTLTQILILTLILTLTLTLTRSARHRAARRMVRPS